MFFAVCTNRNSGAFVGAAGCAATRGSEGAQSVTNSSAVNDEMDRRVIFGASITPPAALRAGVVGVRIAITSA
jgi:hypothetical protein